MIMSVGGCLTKSPPSGSNDQTLLERKRRRLGRSLIALAILVIIGLTVLQTQVVRLGTGVPHAHGILIFALININIVLLFLLLVLVLRNLYKIFFEQRQVLGAQLRTKLVVAFVSLTLVPTVLLFYAAMQFIATGHDYWFNENVEDSLENSLALSQYLSEINIQLTRNFGNNIKDGIIRNRLYVPGDESKLMTYLNEKRHEYHLAIAGFYGPDFSARVSVENPELETGLLTSIPPHVFESAREDGVQSQIDEIAGKDLIRVVWPVKPDENGRPMGYVVAGLLTGAPVNSTMKDLQNGLIAYQQLKKIHDPIRVSHYIALTIVALLSIFVSTWIAFHLAQSITGPIMELAQATDKISHGDYDFTIDVTTRDAEISTLVSSFNRMTRDLKAGKFQLENKNIALWESNRELDKRNRYMEIVLQSVAAGVVSTDANGIVTTVNNSAQEILHFKAEDVINRPLKKVVAQEQWIILDQLINTAESSPRGTAERQIKVVIGDQGLSLHVHLAQLRDDGGDNVGLVIVFDDLSELEKAQRMAAWREVARRIAHEIKNPLTPIQLSTQRLKRRYADCLNGDSQLFDECTSMIIRQVDELKRLVSEFSNFARMPEITTSPNDLAAIVEETLVMYHEAQKEVVFVFERENDLPIFNLDREQMTRVLINLLDNAVAAVENDGRIEIKLTYNKTLKMARLEVADNGVGISQQDKRRLFEPYFSTKKAGTGLGLAIVSTIVTDHDGFVRVQDNFPRGTRFIIELPVRV
jgi:two-component system, NtrC family, nitrogen regulation sensor histidine kinase NtrY